MNVRDDDQYEDNEPEEVEPGGLEPRGGAVLRAFEAALDTEADADRQRRSPYDLATELAFIMDSNWRPRAPMLTCGSGSVFFGQPTSYGAALCGVSVARPGRIAVIAVAARGNCTAHQRVRPLCLAGPNR
jgi:hypothetical protein